MAKYLQRSCPKCNGYLGIVIPERKAKMPVQAINGRWLKMWLSGCLGLNSRNHFKGGWFDKAVILCEAFGQQAMASCFGPFV
jgi:hypothetical protein